MAGLNRVVQPSDLTTGRLRIEMAKEIDELNIDKTPLMIMLSKIGKEKSGRMKFEYLSKERRSDWGTISSVGGAWASGANKAGTIVVPAGEAWMYGVGDIIKIPGSASNANIYVDSISTVTLTCHAYDDSTTFDFSGGADPSAANVLFNISNSFELGTNRGTMKSFQPTENYNLIQIIQHPYGSTETALHVDYDVGGGEMDEQGKEMLIEHEFSKEKLAFFGQRHYASTGYMSASGGLAQYFTGGMYEFISTNVTTEADLTQAEFGAFINAAIYYAKKPTVFTGSRIFEGLSWWLGQNINTTQNEKTLGIAVASYLTQYGDLVHIVPHRELLQKDYAGIAFCIDLADIKYKYLNGEDTHLEVDIETPGDKKKINEYRTWYGVYRGSEKRHGVLKGVTSISA